MVQMSECPRLRVKEFLVQPPLFTQQHKEIEFKENWKRTEGEEWWRPQEVMENRVRAQDDQSPLQVPRPGCHDG
jgi:hypothetical protein